MKPKPLPRWARKLDILSRLRANRRVRAAQQAKKIPPVFKERKGREWEEYHLHVRGHSEREPGETIEQYGERKLVNAVAWDRKHQTEDKNDVRKQVRGSRSKYRLTGLDYSQEWEREIARTIERRGGRAAAEARALEKWLKRPERFRQEMLTWKELRDMDVKRRELESWLKRQDKKK